MKNYFLALTTVLSANLALAHGDHAPRVATCQPQGCTKEQIEIAIPQSIDLLVKSGRIESTWQNAKVEKIELKEFKKASEWTITLVDEKKKNPAKMRLFVFITTKGYLNGANFSGE